MDELKKKYIELQIEAHDDLVGSVKLYFSFATGAAVLLVNAASQPSNLTPGWQALSLSFMGVATFAFALSAVCAMRATTQFSRIKSSMAQCLNDAEATEKAGDVWLAAAGHKLTYLAKELDKMTGSFNVGLAVSVLFVFVRIVAATTTWFNTWHSTVPHTDFWP
jgi:hypothetical protein